MPTAKLMGKTVSMNLCRLPHQLNRSLLRPQQAVLTSIPESGAERRIRRCARLAPFPPSRVMMSLAVGPTMTAQLRSTCQNRHIGTGLGRRSTKLPMGHAVRCPSPRPPRPALNVLACPEWWCRPMACRAIMGAPALCLKRQSRSVPRGQS